MQKPCVCTGSKNPSATFNTEKDFLERDPVPAYPAPRNKNFQGKAVTAAYPKILMVTWHLLVRKYWFFLLIQGLRFQFLWPLLIQISNREQRVLPCQLLSLRRNHEERQCPRQLRLRSQSRSAPVTRGLGAQRTQRTLRKHSGSAQTALWNSSSTSHLLRVRKAAGKHGGTIYSSVPSAAGRRTTRDLFSIRPRRLWKVFSPRAATVVDC